jgi:hypothetical protein
VTGYGLDDLASIPDRGTDFSLRRRFQTQLSIRSSSQNISPEIKWPEREVYHSPPCNAEMRNA